MGSQATPSPHRNTLAKEGLATAVARALTLTLTPSVEWHSPAECSPAGARSLCLGSSPPRPPNLPRGLRQTTYLL